MKKQFSQSVQGVSAEQSRAAFCGIDAKHNDRTMIQQETLTPTLKPYGMGEDTVDRQHYQARLKQEQHKMQRYQVRVVELHTRTYMNGELIDEKVERQSHGINRQHQTTNDFNMQAGQAWDFYQQQQRGIGL